MKRGRTTKGKRDLKQETNYPRGVGKGVGFEDNGVKGGLTLGSVDNLFSTKMRAAGNVCEGQNSLF